MDGYGQPLTLHNAGNWPVHIKLLVGCVLWLLIAGTMYHWLLLGTQQVYQRNVLRIEQQRQQLQQYYSRQKRWDLVSLTASVEAMQRYWQQLNTSGTNEPSAAILTHLSSLGGRYGMHFQQLYRATSGKQETLPRIHVKATGTYSALAQFLSALIQRYPSCRIEQFSLTKDDLAATLLLIADIRWQDKASHQ